MTSLSDEDLNDGTKKLFEYLERKKNSYGDYDQVDKLEVITSQFISEILSEIV